MALLVHQQPSCERGEACTVLKASRGVLRALRDRAQAGARTVVTHPPKATMGTQARSSLPITPHPKEMDPRH